MTEISGYEAVKQVAQEDADWLEVIWACLEWTMEQMEKGQPVPFARATISHRLGRPSPRLIWLVKRRVIVQLFTTSNEPRAYYQLRDPEGVGRALREVEHGVANDKPCEACNGTGEAAAPTAYTKPKDSEMVHCEVCGATGRVPADE